jgi:hypothetical protein
MDATNSLDGGEHTRLTWDGFTCDQNPYTSAATASDCTHECLTCHDHFLPRVYTTTTCDWMFQFHDDAEAANTMRDLVETSKANYSCIRLKIQKYGNVIIKRWLKRSVAEQEKMILKVNSSMYQRKHAGVDVLFQAEADYLKAAKTRIKGPKSEEKYEETNLVPTWNL